MAGNLECTCSYETIGHPDSSIYRKDRTITPGCPTHDPNSLAPMTIVDMLEVLALTQIALDPNAPRYTRSAAHNKAAHLLGLDTIRPMP